MAGAVDDDLRDGTLADRIVAGLVQDGGSHAVDRARALALVAEQLERARSRVRAVDEGHCRVEGAGIVGVEVLERHRLDRRQFGLGHHALRGGPRGVAVRDRRREMDEQGRHHDRQDGDGGEDCAKGRAGAGRWRHRRRGARDGSGEGHERFLTGIGVRP